MRSVHFLSLSFFLTALLSAPAPSFAEESCIRQSVTKVADILKNHKHPCYPWVRLVIDRVVKLKEGTGILASFNRKKTGGLLITARHVSHDYDSPTEDTASGAFGDLANLESSAGFRLRQPFLINNQDANLSLWRLMTPVIFPFFHTECSESTPIKNDYDVYIFGHKASNDIFFLGLTQPLPFDIPSFDELSRADAVSPQGEEVMIIGYPGFYPNGSVRYERSAVEEKFITFPAFATGRLLLDSEAKKYSDKAWTRSCEEPLMKYNPKTDFYIEAQAAPGFSGGGVFDKDGRLLGIISVKNVSYIGGQKHFTGAVRFDHIRQTLLEKIETELPARDQQTIMELLY